MWRYCGVLTLTECLSWRLEHGDLSIFSPHFWLSLTGKLSFFGDCLEFAINF